MSSVNFRITEHKSPCQHYRGYPHSVKHEDAVLHLAVKEYRPRRPILNSQTAVTIIAAQGNGFPKEMYEPLWDELLARENNKFRIRSIWFADMSNQAASYAINREELGDDYHWLDHSRDLLLLVNQFRHKMKPPFVGIAHSLGCSQIAWLSAMHPRLFHSLVLMDPVIVSKAPPGPNVAMMSSMRREIFRSRAVAESQISRNPFFKDLDPRALEAYLKYGLVDREDGSVALATPKAQEAWTYVRANFHPLPKDQRTVEARNKERILNPDLVPFSRSSTTVFTRPESVVAREALSSLRPRTLFVCGESSHINYEDARNELVSLTGIARGGSGGVADGGVEAKIVEDAGHLCCFEKPVQMAADISDWLSKETERWESEKLFWDTYDKQISTEQGTALSETWMEGVKADTHLQRSVKNDTPKL